MKKPFLRVISKALALCVLASLALSFAGVAFATPAPKGLDFVANSATRSGTGWAWNSGTKTLTLNGLNLDVDDQSPVGINLPANAKIILADGSTNRLSQNTSETGKSHDAIHFDGAGTIAKPAGGKGTGKLIVNGATVAVESYGNTGISTAYLPDSWYRSSLTISDVSVEVKAGSTSADSIAYGILAGDLITTNATLNVEAYTSNVRHGATALLSDGGSTNKSTSTNSTITLKSNDIAYMSAVAPAYTPANKVLGSANMNAAASTYTTVTFGQGEVCVAEVQDAAAQVVVISPSYVAVNNITGVATSMTAGKSITLKGVVAPSNATNTKITWKIKSAGKTGAKITNGKLSAKKAGKVVVTATVKNGKTASSDYTKNFTITVKAAKKSLPIPKPTLKSGSKGAGVKKLQTILKVKADGVFGSKTKAALVKWQKAHKVKATGVYNTATYKAMVKAKPTK